MLPAAPQLGALHIASPSDILRLGIVATAGFRYSEHFIWERPFHVDHPLDTITFFRHEVEHFVKSPEHIVLVASDRYDPDESNKTKAVIPDENGWAAPAPEEQVIVGLAVWKLEAGSKRVGKFQNESGALYQRSPFQHILTISKGPILTFLNINTWTKTENVRERSLLWQTKRKKSALFGRIGMLNHTNNQPGTSMLSQPWKESSCTQPIGDANMVATL